MTRVRLTTPRTGTVHYRPGLFARLLGRQERDYEVAFDGWYWIDTTKGCEVPAAVDGMLYQAMAQLDEDRRAIESYTILG